MSKPVKDPARQTMPEELRPFARPEPRQQLVPPENEARFRAALQAVEVVDRALAAEAAAEAEAAAKGPVPESVRAHVSSAGVPTPALPSDAPVAAKVIVRRPRQATTVVSAAVPVIRRSPVLAVVGAVAIVAIVAVGFLGLSGTGSQAATAADGRAPTPPDAGRAAPQPGAVATASARPEAPPVPTGPAHSARMPSPPPVRANRRTSMRLIRDPS